MLFWSLVIPVQRILLSSPLRPPQQIGEGRTSRFYPRDAENPSYATESVALSMGADFHRTMVATGGEFVLCPRTRKEKSAPLALRPGSDGSAVGQQEVVGRESAAERDSAVRRAVDDAARRVARLGDGGGGGGRRGRPGGRHLTARPHRLYHALRLLYTPRPRHITSRRLQRSMSVELCNIPPPRD